VAFPTDKNGEDFWIGANDKGLENDWVWESDKSKLVIRDWHTGQQQYNDRHHRFHKRLIEY
jgi:hypothetical protein